MTVDELNGLAGMAALVNSLLLWPTIRSLKTMASSCLKTTAEHDRRLKVVEDTIPVLIRPKLRASLSRGRR